MASTHSIAHRFEDKERSEDVKVQEDLHFSALLLTPLVQNGLNKSGFVKPSPIQLQAIPLGKFGLDLIVQAKSGTGKTCIFAVIALENINLESPSVQTLVLAPTREIASQICDVILSIGCCMSSLNCHYFIGGLPLTEDRIKLKKCQIAVGTPGRVKQLIECKYLNTNLIRLFVLDEADKLLDKDFQKSINWIYQKLPHNKQMLALSATYPESLAKLLINYMRNPAFVRLNTQKPALLGIIQFYTITKFHPLSHVAFQYKLNMLSDILTNIPFSQCLIFTNLQSRAQLLCEKLNKQGWAATYICGNQNQVQRLRTMAQLKNFQCRILVTTDLTARGIDCQNVDVIINVDLPDGLETYLHRIGRAGRFGSKGLAITIISEESEKDRLFSMNLSASLDIRELPKPLSANVWNSNMKEDDCCNTENNSQFTNTNDSLICILNDDLFNNRKENDKSEENSNNSNSNTLTLEYTGHLNASDAQCPITNNDMSDIDLNSKQYLAEADGICNVKNDEHYELAPTSLNENFEEKIQNHVQNIPNTTFDLHEFDTIKNCHPCAQEEISILITANELKSPTEISKCLSETTSETAINLKDINNQSTKNASFQQENNYINEIDDFSQFYEIKSYATNVSYAEIVEELNNFQIGSKCNNSKQYEESIPSEKLLQEVDCFLNQSNNNYWKCIEVTTKSSKIAEGIEQENTISKVMHSSLSEGGFGTKAEEEIELLPCNTSKENVFIDDDCKIVNAKTISAKEVGDLLHKITHDQSYAITEEVLVDIADVTSAAPDHYHNASLPKLERTDSSYETTSNSSDKQLQIITDDCNLDSATINGSLTVDTSSSIYLPVIELKELDEKHSKRSSLSNSYISNDNETNICNDLSENCKISNSCHTSDDELYYSYSSQYSELEESTSIDEEENSIDDAENVEYIPQDNCTEETLPFYGSYVSPHVFSQKNMQQKECVCNEYAREIPSNWNLHCEKDFLFDTGKRSFEHLPFTSDCWQQNDYRYCSAQAENNYGQLSYCQNHYAENFSYKHHEWYENKHQCIYPNCLVLPPNSCRNLGCINNSCCKYCYWERCYSASKDWCYYYTRYMSEMLKWKKSKKHCSCYK